MCKEPSATESCDCLPVDVIALFGAPEVSRFSLSRETDPKLRAAADVRIIGSMADFVRRQNCREVLIALSWTDTERIDFVREHLKVLPIAAKLLPDLRVRTLSNYVSSARQRILAIEIQRAPFSLGERFIKRSLDILAASFD